MIIHIHFYYKYENSYSFFKLGAAMNITFQDQYLHLVENQKHEFLLSNKEVAFGYGLKPHTLTTHKNEHKDELIEGKHWIRLETQTAGGKQRLIHWTKKGIVRLGFFIKSKQAKKFRDWAEDYIVNPRKNSSIKAANTRYKNKQISMKSELETLRWKVQTLEHRLTQQRIQRPYSTEEIYLIELGKAVVAKQKTNPCKKQCRSIQRAANHIHKASDILKHICH